jgi:predicted transcriptional regulator
MITAGGWKKDGPKLVFIEDMSQSAVKEKSLENLKQRFVPGKNPLILIDNTGGARAKLGIMDDETVILVYDKQGKLVHFAEGPPDEDAAKKIVEAAGKI